MSNTLSTRLAEITVENMSTGDPIQFELWQSEDSFFIEMRNLSSNGTAIVRESEDVEAMNQHWDYLVALFESDPTWGPVEA